MLSKIAPNFFHTICSINAIHHHYLLHLSKKQPVVNLEYEIRNIKSCENLIVKVKATNNEM